MIGEHAAISASDRAWIDRAVTLAAEGPSADPNPRVGAVLVTDEVVVGQGFHRGAGSAHAEAVALADAGGRARGSTAYVSLEPCAHHGRTGPCTTALIDAGVARVVYATADPNPAAAGGAEVLRAGGVGVDRLPHSGADALNRRWSYAIAHDRPFVTWKVGTTLDGRVAASDGSSRWITGPQAREDVHRLRAESGAIVVGTGTLAADDPSLTVRDSGGRAQGRQPLRVVVGRGPVPDEAAVRVDDNWIHITDHEPAATLAVLQEKQIRHVLVEGGPTLAASWLRAGVIQEVVAYVAPVLLGSGRALVGGLGIETLSDAIRLDFADVTAVGDDVRLVLTPRVSTPFENEGAVPCSPE